MSLRRIAAVGLTAAAVFVLLWGDTFHRLTALDSDMAEWATPTLLIGAAGFVVGALLNFRASRLEGRRGVAGRFAVNLAASVILGWIGFATVIYAIQDDLVFSPSVLTEARLQAIAVEYPHAEPVEIIARDGAVLRGWLVPPRGAVDDEDVNVTESADKSARTDGTPPLILVFTGQGGEASRYFVLTGQVPEAAWAFVNYRGYGASDGTPSDKAIFDDATVIYDYFTSRPDVDADYVFALGGSMGTGVATYLASQRPLAGVVLFSPYDRIGGGVTQDLMPWLPTGLLFRTRFDAATYAPDVQAPVLAIVGSEDKVILPARSEALLRRWGGETELLVIEGGDHYTIYGKDEAWEAVRRFIRSRLGAGEN